MPRARRLDVQSPREWLPWPDPRSGPWYVRAHWAEVDDRPECVGLELWKSVLPISPTDGDHTTVELQRDGVSGIAGSDLRGIPLASLLGALWAEYRRIDAQLAEIETTREDDPSARAASDRLFARRRRGQLRPFVESEPSRRASRVRRTSDDVEHFRRVTEVYIGALRQPGKRKPTHAVSEELKVSQSTATKWVARCRDLGLLDRTTRGRPSPIPGTSTRRPRATGRKGN
jgi:hypothetical protein